MLQVHQLNSETGEEALLLTACVGEFSHLGSEKAERFLAGNDDIRQKFMLCVGPGMTVIETCLF